MDKKRIWSFVGASMSTMVFPYILKNFNEKEALSNSIFTLILFFSFYEVLDYAIKHSDYRLRKLAIIWGMLTSFCMIIGANIIKNEVTEISQIDTWVKIILLFPLMACTFILLFCLIRNIALCSEKSVRTSISSRKCFMICWFGIFFVWIPSFFSAYPGIYAYDCIHQIKWYIDGNVYTHHPIIHTYLLSFFIIKLGRDLFGSLEIGLFLYSIFQMLCMSAIFSALYTFYIKEKLKSKWRYVILAWFAFYPVNAILAFSATKDVLYAGIFMLCMMLSVMVIEKEDILTSKRFCFLFGLLWFGEMIFRNQGKYVFAVGIVFLLLAVKKYRKRLLVLTLIICILFGVYDGPVTTAIAYRRGDTINEMMSIPCVQLSRAMLYDKLNEEEEQLITEYIPDYESYGQFPAIADSMKSTFNSAKFRENPIEFIKLWGKVGVKHLDTYIDAFSRITIGFWYPDMNYRDEGAFHPYWEWLSIGQNDPTPFIDYTLVKREPVKGFRWLEKFNYTLTYDNWYQKIPMVSMLFSSGIVIWCVFFYALYAVYYKKYRYLAVASIPVALWLTLLLGPVVLYRYIYPIVLTVPVLFASCSGLPDVKI